MSLKFAKDQFIAKFGEHAWSWQSILNLSPELIEASLGLRSIPKRKTHRFLTPKVQSLCALAVDSASTHLYVPGIQEHIQTAIKIGATAAEIVELTATLGIHTCNIGVPILAEALREKNHPAGHATPLDARQEQIKEEFTKNRGYWRVFWEDFLRLDPDFFEAYLNFSSVPWMKKMKHGDRGALKPKICLQQNAIDRICHCQLSLQVKELICCAFDVAATHPYGPGLKLHTRNTLVEVLEIVTALSLHTANIALSMLERAFR